MSFIKKIVFILFFGIVWLKGFSQESGEFPIEENGGEKWEEIIDYLAAEFTYEYILELESNGQLKPDEKESFNKFREQLANNTIDGPFSPNALKSLMNEKFKNTYGNLTQEIYSFKNLEPKTADQLFQKTDSLLAAVKSNLKSSIVYDNIKNNIFSELEENESNLDSYPVNTEEVSNDEFKSESFLPEWFFKALSGILLLTTFFFYLLYRSFRNEARKLRNNSGQPSMSANQISRGEQNYNRKWGHENNSLTKPGLSTGLEKSQRKPENDNYSREGLNKNTSVKTQSISDPKFKKKEKESFVEAADTNDVKSETHTPNNKELTYDHLPANILYAGKPTNNGWFKDAEKLQGDNHIYELKLSSDSEAEFSLLELSNYMKTEVINSPDDYLYRVCINENSNQEYRNEIITTKRGIAHKVDGKWKVNEEDKATIKFQ